MEIKGIYASAKIFTTDNENGVDNHAAAQIKMLCDNETSKGCQIRVMPDVHPGKVGTIGLTMTVGERILPNLVGTDIGCGVAVAQIQQKKMEFQKLDAVIRDHVPAGGSVRKKPHRHGVAFDLSRLRCAGSIRQGKALLSVGTLGGGNHFIEIDKDNSGVYYAAIHTGSRHLGKEVTDYYLRAGQEYLKGKGIHVPYELTWLEGNLMEDYLHDLQVTQEYAAVNRDAILDELAKGMKWKISDCFSCVHNYVDFRDGEMILRKGAVSARAGEKVIIPVNMRDGIILGIGLGNADWNYSAPHGSGRLMKREDVRRHFTVSAYKAEMRGIYSTCIGSSTLDEAPFAYRGVAEIAEAVSGTVEVREVIKPVYSFKAGSED